MIGTPSVEYPVVSATGIFIAFMINNSHVTPVGIASELPNPQVHVPTVDELETMLSVKDVHVVIGKSLKGPLVALKPNTSQ